ncbi:hypothetical protein SAMN03159443_02347 [Pseudomonas sp. NFACC15-1]|uniref:hypothetical protein n=1 Tax=unclassified Pseudomonas TaxID=196821 RepID=UPI00087FCFFB|nr:MULTISPECIES: hypothetical protein [unclassified Pseudomonas]SDA69322.1 hypothetical protein SAMN03159443_02347 [Pseudomonas sp. NFACC15-1]SDX36783.1 hypothetical protein SAMN03159380_02091 [Pseudomonas sp. NFACC14]
MKSKLFFALALSVLAANSFATDGFDRTGSAAAIDRYNLTDAATVATDGHDHTDPTTVAADGNDRTGSARTD